VGAELNYAPIEKICVALMFAIQKLKHYTQDHTMQVVSNVNPSNISRQDQYQTNEWQSGL